MGGSDSFSCELCSAAQRSRPAEAAARQVVFSGVLVQHASHQALNLRLAWLWYRGPLVKVRAARYIRLSFTLQFHIQADISFFFFFFSSLYFCTRAYLRSNGSKHRKTRVWAGPLLFRNFVHTAGV